MPRRPSDPTIKRVRLSEAIDHFFASLPENLAHGTVRNKARVLSELRIIAGGGQVWTCDLTSQTFQDVLNSLTKGKSEAENRQRRLRGLPPMRGRSDRSLTIDRAALKQFVKHCKAMSWMSGSVVVPEPITVSTKPSGDDLRNRPIIPAEDFLEILELADAVHPRVRMAVAIGLLWARRISEILDARWGDIDFGAGIVTLRNIKRGGRTIKIPLDNAMRAELARWEKWITPLHGVPQPDWYLVPSRLHSAEFYTTHPHLRAATQRDPRIWPVNPRKMTQIQMLTYDIQKVLRKYGIGSMEGQGGHTLRRSGARAFQQRFGVEVAQALLDHESQVTTYRYTQNIDGLEKLEAAMAGKDPLNLLRHDNMPGTVLDFASRRRNAG